MSTQASLDVTATNTILASWGDSVAAHLITTETAVPSTLHEGKYWVRTDQDRLWVRDGSSNNKRVGLGQYSSSGRTWCSVYSTTGAGYATATLTKVAYGNVTSDADGIYTGWDGSQYMFTIPSGLGGLWHVSWHGTMSATGGSNWYYRLAITSGATIYGLAMPSVGALGASSQILALGDGATFAFNLYHDQGTTLSGTLYVNAVYLGP